MGVHPAMKDDIAALVTAISISGSEAPIVAALVDESFVPGVDEGRALFDRVREWVES